MIKHVGSKREGGFTLVEIMIVVAIIGILASIAIPNFLVMQLRSKRAESPLLLSGLVMAEKAYFQAFGNYLTTGVAPRSAKELDGTAVHWEACGGEDSCNWKHLGFVPAQPVYCNYEAYAEGQDEEILKPEEPEEETRGDSREDVRDDETEPVPEYSRKPEMGPSERPSKILRPTFDAFSTCDIDNDGQFTYFYGSDTEAVGFESPGDSANY